MDYLALRIPSDMKQKMTASTWTGTPPLQGSNGIYEQTGCELVDIVPAMYYDAKLKLELILKSKNLSKVFDENKKIAEMRRKRDSIIAARRK